MTIQDVARLALLTPVEGPDQRADLECCAAWIAKAAAADNAEPGSCRLGLPMWAAKALHAYGGAARSPPLLPPDAARALASQALNGTAKEKASFRLSIVRHTVRAMAAMRRSTPVTGSGGERSSPAVRCLAAWMTKSPGFVLQALRAHEQALLGPGKAAPWSQGPCASSACP